MNYKQRGFTLIEIVVGIVVLAVSLTIVTSVFLPQANKMTGPMYQIKATALGKSIMNQVLIRYYDELNVSSGSFSPCTDTTCSSVLGPELPELRSNPDGFNDVDDYDIYCDDRAGYNPSTALGFFTSDYPGYGLKICVSLAADKFGGTAGDKHIAKRITMTIFMPNNEEITLTSFKGNY